MKLHPRKVIAAKNRKGIFVIVSAVILTALFGFLAVATDTGWLFHQRRRMQAAADAGALYGAQQIRRGKRTPADVESLSDHGAFKGTADNGFTNGTDGAVVTVDYPPATGNYVGNDRAVEVTICQPQRTFFMPVFGVDSADVCTRAVAGYLGQSEGCIYALNPTIEKAMHVHSNTTANVDCGVIINSSNVGGLYVSSGSCLATTSASVNGANFVGDDDDNNCGYGNGLAVSTEPSTLMPQEPDPLIGLPVPPEVDYGCYRNAYEVKLPADVATLQPDKKWCWGLLIDCATCGTITLPSGNYVMAGGSLTITGSTTVVHGSEVMFYATDFPSMVVNAEGILVGSGATVNLSAPSSGDFEGILMYVDRDLYEPPHSLDIDFQSGVTADLNGALYTANGTVMFHSDTSGISTSADGVAIVADIVEITSLGVTGGLDITEDYSAFATKSPIKRATLLE